MEEDNKIFYCYSLRLFHYISAFGLKCSCSKKNALSGKRYWVFNKSEKLDRIIESYNNVKHKFN